MSYRSHGTDDARYSYIEGSPSLASPYTPESDQFLISPASPNRPPHTFESEYSQLPKREIPRKPVPSPQYAPTESSRPPPKLSRTKALFPKWTAGLHWYVPTTMTLVFLCGCAGAIAHHVFYSYLHGKPAHNQLMMNRIGVAFAFFTKASLVGSVILAYRQRMWQTVRERPISLQGLDALFQVVENPSWFFLGPEMFYKARIATFMALATWLIPIASVLAPGSLTAQLFEVDYSDIGNCTVSTLNFSVEAISNWRHPTKRPGYNIAFWNTTPPPPADSIADWYDQPAFQTVRLTTLAFYGRNIVVEDNSPCPLYNCSYTTQFHAPWYNCSKITFDDLPPDQFSIDDFVPHSKSLAEGGLNYIYKAQVFDNLTEYKDPYPGYNSKDYVNQGTFRGDPDVYLGFVVNTTKPVEDVTPKTRWNFTMDPQAWRCEHQKAKYTVRSQWTDNRLTNRIATVSDGVALLPRGKVLGPKTDTIERYREFVAYYTVGSIMRDKLKGTLTQDNQTLGGPVTKTDLSKTRLVDTLSQYPVDNFIPTLQRFYEDLVMSFMSEPNFEITQKTDVPCARHRWENRFRYLPYSLWIGYAIVMFVSFCSIIAGAISLHKNGYCSDTTFSKIMVTTRNPTLDRIVKSYLGVALGADPMPKELGKLQLQFGVVDSEEESSLVKHTAFGLPEETTILKGRQGEYMQNEIELRRRRSVEMGRGGALSASGLGLGYIPG